MPATCTTEWEPPQQMPRQMPNQHQQQHLAARGNGTVEPQQQQQQQQAEDDGPHIPQRPVRPPGPRPNLSEWCEANEFPHEFYEQLVAESFLEPQDLSGLYDDQIAELAVGIKDRTVRSRFTILAKEFRRLEQEQKQEQQQIAALAEGFTNSAEEEQDGSRISHGQREAEIFTFQADPATPSERSRQDSESPGRQEDPQQSTPPRPRLWDDAEMRPWIVTCNRTHAPWVCDWPACPGRNKSSCGIRPSPLVLFWSECPECAEPAPGEYARLTHGQRARILYGVAERRPTPRALRSPTQANKASLETEPGVDNRLDIVWPGEEDEGGDGSMRDRVLRHAAWARREAIGHSKKGKGKGKTGKKQQWDKAGKNSPHEVLAILGGE